MRFNVPWTIINASTIEKNVNSRSAPDHSWVIEPIYNLIEKSDFDMVKAQQGLLFIDDFDQGLSRVIVDPYYNRLGEQIIPIWQGQPVSLKTAQGQTIKFDTKKLFVVLGGNFRFTDQLGKTFLEDSDSSIKEKYQQNKLQENLCRDFNLSATLLRYLIPITMDLSLDESSVEKLIRKYISEIIQKYSALNYKFTLLTEADHTNITKKVLESGWKSEEMFIQLENYLLEHFNTTSKKTYHRSSNIFGG